MKKKRLQKKVQKTYTVSIDLGDIIDQVERVHSILLALSIVEKVQCTQDCMVVTVNSTVDHKKIMEIIEDAIS